MSPTQPSPVITFYLRDWLLRPKFFPEIFFLNQQLKKESCSLCPRSFKNANLGAALSLLPTLWRSRPAEGEGSPDDANQLLRSGCLELRATIVFSFWLCQLISFLSSFSLFLLSFLSSLPLQPRIYQFPASATQVLMDTINQAISSYMVV